MNEEVRKMIKKDRMVADNIKRAAGRKCVIGTIISFIGTSLIYKSFHMKGRAEAYHQVLDVFEEAKTE